MGVHCSKASPRSSRSRLRSPAALILSASPVQSRGLSQSSSASLSCRAITRARAAARDCSDPSGKSPGFMSLPVLESNPRADQSLSVSHPKWTPLESVSRPRRPSGQRSGTAQRPATEANRGGRSPSRLADAVAGRNGPSVRSVRVLDTLDCPSLLRSESGSLLLQMV